MNKKTFLSFVRRQSACIAVLLAIAATAALASCSDDDTPGNGAPDPGNAIRFTTAIARFTNDTGPGTRATIDPDTGTGSFATDDETTIIGFAYEAMPIVPKESPATYNGETWTTGMTWDEFYEGAYVTFSAFFPKLSLGDFDKTGLMKINLPTDQSTPEQHAAYDWLHARANGQETGQPIKLTFNHLMHRLTVNLSLSDTPGSLKQADVDNATVVIKNMETKGVVNFNGGVEPQAGNTGDFTPLESAGNTFRVLLLPQSVTPGTPWIEITVGGKTVTYAIPAGLTTLHEGKEQVVNLKLTNAATTAKAITLSGQKNTITAGVGGTAKYDISTTDIDISNSLLFAAGATVTWYAAAEGGEPISLPTGINGYTLTSENDSKGVFDVKFLKTLSAGDYYFTVTYGGATSNRVKLTVG
ncbi:fimbrillin family protein [Bacteroides uniformis]|uniref:fimbrillin family protein n=1 Tax=Bacteroides uniformis TaxID=820 RepID=UPI0018982D23|nr:fimbrillin family protein [Bacteroides uniformis]